MKKEERIEISDDLKVKLISIFVFRDFLSSELHDHGDIDFDGNDLQSAAHSCINVLKQKPYLLDRVVCEIDVDSRVKFSSMDIKEFLKSITPLLVFTYQIWMAVKDDMYKGKKLSEAIDILEYHLSRFAKDPGIIDKMAGRTENAMSGRTENEINLTEFGFSNN